MAAALRRSQRDNVEHDDLEDRAEAIRRSRDRDDDLRVNDDWVSNENEGEVHEEARKHVLMYINECSSSNQSPSIHAELDPEGCVVSGNST